MKDELKQARISTGLSQQAVSDKLEIPRRTIQNWESGVNVPPDYVAKWYLEKLKALKK